MKINILFLYLMGIIVLSSIVHAGDIGTVNQSITLYADVLTASNYYQTTSANITVRNSTGAIVANNLSMTALTAGLYAYNFTPNTTGVYYTVTVFGNSTGVIGLASSTFYIQEPFSQVASNMSLSIIFAIGIAAAILLYLAFKVPSEHPFLQFLFIMISLVLLVMLGLAAVESRNNCLVYTNNGVATQSCATSTDSSPSVFSQIIIWTFVITILYIFVYILYKWLGKLKEAGSI